MRIAFLLLVIAGAVGAASPPPHTSPIAVRHVPHPSMHPFGCKLELSAGGDGAPASGARVHEVRGTDEEGRAYRVHPQQLAGKSLPFTVSVIALREGLAYDFVVSGVDGAGAAFEQPVAFHTRRADTDERMRHMRALGAPPTTDPTYAYAPPVVPTPGLNYSKMSPGWTWWSNFPGGNNSAWAGSRMVDAAGNTRWYTDCYTMFYGWFPKILDFQASKCGITGTQTKLKNGNLLVNFNTNMAMVSGAGVSGLAEVTPTGEVLNTWVSALGIPADQEQWVPPNARRIPLLDMNHDVQELPNGNWMIIAFDDRNVTGGSPTATCPDWTEDKYCSGNVVVEFMPYDGNGTVVKRWSTFDALDVCATYKGVGAWPAPEWIHMNAFDTYNVFEQDRNELIVSSFSLGWVWAMRYADDENGKAGSLMWLLGKPRPPSTAGPTEVSWFNSQPHFELDKNETESYHWQQGQHDANIVGMDGNSLVMFDNGAKTGGKDAAWGSRPSRLLQFDITNRPTKASPVQTTTINFEYNTSDGGKAPYLGGARRLENDNFLVQFGALTDKIYPETGAEGPCDAPCEKDTINVCMHPRFDEVTPEGEVVSSMMVGGRYRGKCYGWTGYRAYRMPPDSLDDVFGRYMAEY